MDMHKQDILSKITFHLCDLRKELVDAWREKFQELVNFQFHQADIFSIPASEETNNAIVFPTNCVGGKQDGLSTRYYEYFAVSNLEDVLQNLIVKDYYGELPIGNAILVATETKYQCVIATPTAYVPMEGNKFAPYWAFRAVLIQLLKLNSNTYNPVVHVFCPGLAESFNSFSAENCAKQMLAAYKSVIEIELDLTRKSQNYYAMAV